MNGKTTPWREKQKQIQMRKHTVKDGFLLVVVNRHFSKLKPGSNGDEDQARALGNSGSSLSLSRNCSVSLKLGTPSLSAQIFLKGQPWAKHGRGHDRGLVLPARVLPRVKNTPARVDQNTVVPKYGHDRVLI
ncbi:unnamed protein product [Linum trigynum]|uniref:Uncharacterized protein n=1 Tax=Linum trigynum TaxID=586398 RepID=A0AAV2GBG3_9ROSI